MLNANAESLLQEIATEMAFLSPAQDQGLDLVAELLVRLGQEPDVQALPGAQMALSSCLGICQQAMANRLGLTQLELAAFHD